MFSDVQKAVQRTTTTDDKRLQNTLKRVGVNTIPGIEEVNIFSGDSVIHFTNPKGAQRRRALRNSALQRRRRTARPQRPQQLTGQPHCSSQGAVLRGVGHADLGRCSRGLQGTALHFHADTLTMHCSHVAFGECAVQASIAANTYVVSGPSQTKSECQTRKAGQAAPAVILVLIRAVH